MMGDLYPAVLNAASRAHSKLDTLAVFFSEMRIFRAISSLGREDRRANVSTKAHDYKYVMSCIYGIAHITSL